MMSTESLKNSLLSPKREEKKVPTNAIEMLISKGMQVQIQTALPSHMTADRMIRIVRTEMRKNPKLESVNMASLVGSVMQCAQLGLEPGSALGHAYLIPYGREVNLIIGYRGMIDLARRSGQIISLSARAVFEHDKFEYKFGLAEDLIHVPAQGNRGDLTHVYAVAKLKEGGVQFEVMTKTEINAVMNQSKSANNGPWKTHFEEMAKKTAIRRLFKYLPVSIEIQTAIGLDEQAEAGVNQNNASLIDGEYETWPTPESEMTDEAGGE